MTNTSESPRAADTYLTPAPEATTARISSSHRQRRVALFFLLGSLGCLADLLTKQWVFAWLGTPPESSIYWIWEHFFALETSINRGALFGMGQGQVGLFAAISVVALVGIFYWVFRGGAVECWLTTVALGGILGGVLGNLYDRLGWWGQVGVRDWIRVSYYEHVWPNFNIADSLLVCGAALLMWHALRNPA